jgi:hypothetical protein
LIFISGPVVFSQEQNHFSFDAGLCRNYGGFFDLYNGVAEFGGNYQVHIIHSLYSGIGLHIDYIKRKNTSARTIFYKPQLNIQYIVKINGHFHIVPGFEAGFTFVNLSNKEYHYKETQEGLNFGADLRLLWITKHKTDFYLFVRYDYIHLTEDDDFTRLDRLRKIQLTGIGFGIRLKKVKDHD